MVASSVLESLQEMFDLAKVKADKVNPEIHVIETGLYQVQGSKGKWYEVRCGRNQDGFFVACQCYGALHEKPCYHGAKALYYHISLKLEEIEQRKKQEQENALYSKAEIPSEKLDGVRI